MIDETLKQRGERYGEFTDHANLAQDLKAVMHAAPSWSTKLAPDMREALEMIQHKVARILNGDPYHLDSWHDIIGYARLVEQRLIGKKVLDEELRRPVPGGVVNGPLNLGKSFNSGGEVHIDKLRYDLEEDL